jgi:hypothetical protein
MKKKEPSTNSDNGKDSLGRFEQGNKYGMGNPFAKKTAQLRAALLNTVTPADVAVVIKVLIRLARGGDLVAIKELLDRAIGKSLECDLLEKIETLEKAVNEFERANKCD